MNTVNLIDLILVTCVVAAAGVYIAWALLGGRSAPPCHNVAPSSARAAEHANVIVGASLQRGLDRARAKRR